MKTLLIAIYSLFATLLFAQSQQQAVVSNRAKGYLLDSIFPIDNIESVQVINWNGTHTLTQTELTFFKQQLKKAKYAGGLLVKPGHITINIKLKNNAIAKAGFVYATTGSIHFDGGINKFKEHFSGTFHLPMKLNFDNYK